MHCVHPFLCINSDERGWQERKKYAKMKKEKQSSDRRHYVQRSYKDSTNR